MNSGMIRFVAVPVAALMLMGCTTGEESTPVEPPDLPPADEVIDDAYDREESRQRATALLGVHEDDVEESAALRIVRRGDEHFAVTMDLRPGRLNVELDERDDGFVVTRVVVETADGEDPLVVE